VTYIIGSLVLVIALLVVLWRMERSLRGRAEARAESLGVLAREAMDANDQARKILNSRDRDIEALASRQDRAEAKLTKVSEIIDRASGSTEKIAGLWRSAMEGSDASSEG